MPDPRKVLVKRGLDGARDEYAGRNDQAAESDLEIEVEFWLQVEQCEFCGPELCTIHFDRMVSCL